MIDEKIIQIIDKNFGLKISEVISVPSYFTRVSELITDKGVCIILKVLPEFYENNIRSYDAVIAVCELINKEIPELQTLKHLRSQEGQVVYEWEKGKYFVLFEKHPIFSKDVLTVSDQQNLGRLMSVFHTKLKNFSHPYLGTTHWMRKIDKDGIMLLSHDFLEKEFYPYLEFAHNIDYKGLELTLTTIHGDWHRGNMSFTQPPFLFDYDTLSRGAAVEDIARTLTQWKMDDKDRLSFYANFLDGYVGLTANEKNLIPKLMIAQLFSNYIYFRGLQDDKNALNSKEAIPIIKQLFNLI